MRTTLIITFFLTTTFSSCNTDKAKQAKGEEIYLLVEKYRKDNGRLPNNISEIGMEEKMEGPIYYNKKTDTTYIIYYGEALGESIVFNPKTRKWKSDRQ